MLKEIIENNANVRPNSELLSSLRQGLPQFFDKDGNFRADKFAAELRESDITEAHDGYRLSFVGKDYARLQTGQASETMIEPDMAHNALPENEDSQNIFITGDNLEALRHLRNAYAGKVKMIYIDPPYNTGSDGFVYNDRFEFTDERLKSALGYSDEETARLKSIQGKSSHSAWLTFIYPRLKLAQKLLTDDGVIFVSIDDNEQANLKLLMDDVFGEGNFVSVFVWQDKYTTTNDKQGISSQTDYILCYAKKGIMFLPNKLPLKEDYIKSTYINDDKDGRGKYRLVQMYKKKNPNSFDVISPTGKRWNLPWNFKKENFEQMDKENRVYWGKDGNAQPQKKVYLSESTGINPISLLFGDVVGWSGNGGDEIEELFSDRNMFSYPKNTKLIKHLMKIATHKDDIILDFFAGSGTTAHAVMQLNADDLANGKEANRKFIMVQIDEPTKQDSEARKAGYETIDEISRERIKRAAAKIKADSPMFAGSLDLGFKHYRLKTPTIATLDKITDFSTDDLFGIDMIPEMGGLESILTTWLIDRGNTFDTKVEEVTLSYYTAHYVAESQTLYLINEGFETEALKTMLNKIGKDELTVSTIVVYPYSFTFESMRELEIGVKSLDNTPQIIKNY